MTDKYTESNSWIIKYKPKSSDDIVGNNKAKCEIRDWLRIFPKYRKQMLKQISYNKNKKRKKKKLLTESGEPIEKSPVYKHNSCMLIMGSHGIGKSITIELLLKEHNYTPHIVKFDSIKNTKTKAKGSKNNDDIIKNLTNSSNIIDIMRGNSTTNIALIIDDIESVTSTSEKSCLEELQKQNDTCWHCPIIFISTNKHCSLLTKIKKHSVHITFRAPYDTEMIRILHRIHKEEKLKIGSEEVALSIISHAQSDIRRLIYTLQDLHFSYNNTSKSITMDTFSEYCECSKLKDINYDLYRATEGLLYNYKDIQTSLDYYETEKVLLPLMIQQNYLNMILAYISDKPTQFMLLDKIAKLLSKGDVIENYIYGDQNWDMQEIHGISTCVLPSYELFSNCKITPQKIKLVFPDDLNRTSIKNINKKNKTNAEKCFKNMNIFDCIYINKIIRKLIMDDKIEECVKLMKGYDLKLEYIESLLKIDKIKNSKPTITSSQRKNFLQYMNK
jgi:replication factor C subunit 1